MWMVRRVQTEGMKKMLEEVFEILISVNFSETDGKD
jgi:hypothetical protein